MNKKNLLKKINDFMFSISRCTELIISIIITVVIAVLIVDLVYDLTQTSLFDTGTDYFMTFLAASLNLVIGVEFVKMLCKHTPETLIEVLMFATARQMVVEHPAPWELLIGIVSIAILFAIRKYLFLKNADSENMSDTFL